MISKLIKIANKFDSEGKVDKADRLDNSILKYAQEDREPTPEDLMREEEWLSDEGVNPYALSEEDALEGLEGDDEIVAEEYMDGAYPEDIKKMMVELNQMQDREGKMDKKQQHIMDQLSQVLMQGAQSERSDPSRLDM